MSGYHVKCDEPKDNGGLGSALYYSIIYGCFFAVLPEIVFWRRQPFSLQAPRVKTRAMSHHST